MFSFKQIFATLSVASLVAAHGYIDKIKINGETFEGNQIGSSDKDSVIRSVTTQDPMKGADNKDLACGPGSKPAKKMADINPGDEIEFSWVEANGAPWPHEMGPMITYMGYCGKGGKSDCSQSDASSVRWFKIDNAGTKEDGTWYLEELMQGGSFAKVKIPEDVAAGNYLIRHEIVALHLANEMGGAEFYAGCAQLSVGGSGSDSPEDSELVKFPGAYKDDDAGIYVPDVFNGKNQNYKFPGGDVAKLVSSGGYMDAYRGGSSSTGADDEEDSSASASAGPSGTSTASDDEPSSSPEEGRSVDLANGDCDLTADKINANSTTKRDTYHPKRISRIMRDLVSSGHHS